MTENSDQTPSRTDLGARWYAALSLLSGASFVFALNVTSGHRGPLAGLVLVLLGAAVLWNLLNLGRRLA